MKPLPGSGSGIVMAPPKAAKAKKLKEAKPAEVEIDAKR
jgi:hypothetical protein